MATKQTTDEGQGGFDLAAWLGGASRPERVVTLYAANAVQAQIVRLEEERRLLVERAKGGDDRWGAPAQAADTDRIDKDLARLRKQIEDSGVDFTVRALDSDDEDAIIRANPIAKDATQDETNRVAEARLYQQLVTQIVEPRRFSVEELNQLRKAVGEPEFLKLAKAAQDTGSELAASSPFWRGNSGPSRS